MLTDGPAREEAQARNLAALIQAAPSRKVVVYCGDHHAAKRHKPVKLIRVEEQSGREEIGRLDVR